MPDLSINATIQSITKECSARHVDASPTLVAFMTRAAVLEKPEIYHADAQLKEEDVAALVAVCVERLCARDSPSLQTVRLQVRYEEEHLRQDEKSGRSRRKREDKLAHIFNEIQSVHVKSESDFESLTVLYRRIFSYVMVCTGADDGDDKSAERENAAALESVFPRVALSSFVELSVDDKLMQLRELSNIIFGIRVFNRDIGKGGAAIPDVPAQLEQTLALLQADVAKRQGEVAEVLEQFVVVMRYLSLPGQKEEPGRDVMARRVRSEMAFWRQYETYMALVASQAADAAARAAETTNAFGSDLGELQEIVGAKTSVPKEKVYPRFDALAGLWQNFEATNGESERLMALYIEVEAMGDAPFKPAMRLRDVEAARTALAAAAGADAAAGEAAAAEVAAPASADTVVVGAISHGIPPEVTAVEFAGFDPVALAQEDGALLAAVAGSGPIIVAHKGKHYALGDVAAANAFLADPDAVIAAALATAQSSPELVNLLGVAPHFPSVSIRAMVTQGVDGGDGSLLYMGEASVGASKEFACQTETHPIESRIDPKYEWNEWALRKRALMLTNLRTKRTHSTQTQESNFRRDGETQHYGLRDSETNTMRSTGTNPPISRNYITGLRGHPDEVMHVVNVSLDI